MRYVFKFGGTSLSSAQKIKKVARFIKAFKKDNPTAELAVVVSAMGKTTNSLDALGKSLGLRPSFQARLITMGEEISSVMLVGALNNIGIKSCAMSASDIKILCKGSPLDAIITHVDSAELVSRLKENVVVVPGFQGVNESGEVVSLGRGGSDTTAVALGIALNAKVHIFTDVNYFYSFDPYKFSARPTPIKKINIYSSIEAAYSGAGVLDKRCLCLANKFKTQLSLAKSCSLSGSVLSFKNLESAAIDSISYKNDLLFVKISSKNSDFIQEIINFEFKPIYIFFAKNSLFMVFEENIELKKLLRARKKKIFKADLVTLTGSGLVSSAEAREKLQNAVKKHEIGYHFIEFAPTTIKILTESGAGEELTKVLISELNL